MMFPAKKLQNKSLLYTLLLFIFLYIWRSVNKKSKLIFAKTENNLALLKKCPTILKKVFLPTIYLQHSLLQSMFASLLPPKGTSFKYSIEEVTMEGGGHTNIAWVHYNGKHSEASQNELLVLLLPGITGSAEENYIKDLALALCRSNYRCAVYHTRMNSSKLVLPNEGYVDIVKDFKTTIDYIKEREPSIKIFGIGHSYGANLLLNYLGTYVDNSVFIGGVSLANPFNFMLGESKARRSVVNSKIAECLHQVVDRSKKDLADAINFKLNLEELKSYSTVREFDKNFTIRIYGYQTVDDYYWDASSCRRLRFIKVPIFMLQAEDDPISDVNSFVQEEIESYNANVIVMITPRGGHQGWIEGFFMLKRWYIKPTLEFLEAVLRSECRQYQ